MKVKSLGNKILSALLTLILLELTLGGGGRIFSFGFFTLRMYLFFVALTISIILILVKNKVDKVVIQLIIFFIFIHVLGITIGLFNKATSYLIFEDIKPLVFFLIIVFYSVAVTRYKDVEKVNRIIKFSSFFLAVSYLILFFLINFRLINFPNLYTILSSSGEFFFRGEMAFFYKGFLYLCVGFFFFFFENNKKSKFYSLIVFFAILLTFTRGFILAFFLTFVAYYIFAKFSEFKTIIISTFAILIIFTILFYYSKFEIGDKASSNIDRITQIEQVFERVTPFSVILGHGFGIGVPIRTVHMEISYLEIFHKQGILGLSFYILILLILIRFYNICAKKEIESKIKPFLFASFFVFLQSFTNPFINNPIGMTVIIISIICLKVLSQEVKNANYKPE